MTSSDSQLRLANFVSEIPTRVKDSTAHAIMTVIVKIGVAEHGFESCRSRYPLVVEYI